MYNSATILSNFRGLIGWRQNDDQSAEQLGLNLTNSSSGRYYNSEHPLLTFNNLFSVAIEYSRLTYSFDAWDSGTTYAYGDKVTHSGTNYICIQESTNHTPPNTTYWEVYKPFSEWLNRETDQAILQAFSAWVTLKLNNRSAKALLNQRKLYRGSGDISLKDVNNSNFVGHQITPVRARHANYKVTQIGLQFDTNEDKTIYLFKSTQVTPVYTEVLSYSGSGSLQWFSVDWDMEPNGVYYVGYDQSVIAGQSINGARDAYVGRGGRSIPSNNFYLFSPFSVGDYSGSMWSPDKVSYNVDTNYGINLDIKVSCDYTSLFVDNKVQFADMIAKFVAIYFLKKIMHNPEARVNRNQANADTSQLTYEIDGDSSGRPGGIKYEYEKSLNAITLDYIELDKVCLPCRKKGSTWKLA